MGFSGRIVGKVHDNARNICKAMREREEEEGVEEEEEVENASDEEGNEDVKLFRTEVGAIEGESVRCHAHILNLVVSNCLKHPGSVELKKLLKKLRNIVGHFKHASTLKEMLCGLQAK